MAEDVIGIIWDPIWKADIWADPPIWEQEAGASTGGQPGGLIGGLVKPLIKNLVRNDDGT